MPLTRTGDRVLGKMEGEYGTDKGKRIFYASMNKGVPGSKDWHKGGSQRSIRRSSRSPAKGRR